ncbi:CAP domain-containing protein [Paenibacillus yonginensis]|uniref:CAP domain-containing protein n=1 Tax=Paenibacillus yonginensis TaxID=1462996 RepID=UPI0008397765|nr:CAP domain-containing protein [Paenibacillus yonginensis]
MNKKITKRIAAGGFAVLMSMGLVLPTYAASSTGGTTANQQTTTTHYKVTSLQTTTINFSNLSSYLSNFDWNKLLDQLQGAGGQVQQVQPTQPAQPSQPVKPAQPAKPSQPAPTKPTTEQPGTTKPATPPASPAPSQPAQQPAAGQQQTADDQSDFVKQVISLVNQERAKENLKPLTEDSALSNMALVKAKDMSQNNYFDHNSPTYGSPFDMMKQFNISFSYAGENIAKGQKTPQEVMTAWMNSAGHRANIMNANYTVIGVGYYNGCWVQEFVGR